MQYVGLRTNLSCINSSVPTSNQVLVPETLLKKRKSQEKARAERNAAAEKKKTVSAFAAISSFTLPYMMHNKPSRLDYGRCCWKLTFFRV